MADPVQIIIADRRLAKLGNAISGAIHEALADLAAILAAKANWRAGGGRA